MVRRQAPGSHRAVRAGPPRDVEPRVAIDAADPESRQSVRAAAAGFALHEGDGPPDAVVLAVDVEGDDLAARIRAAAEQADGRPLVVVAPSGDPRVVRAALGAGAAAYVVAEEMDRTLPSAIAGALSGQLVAPAALRAQFNDPLLSNREKQMLAMLVLGLTNQEIATKLVVTESTVKSHLTTAYRKLGVRSRKEAAAAILRQDGFGTGILSIGATDEAVNDEGPP